MLIHQGSLLVSTHYKGSYEKNNFSWLNYGGNGNPLQYSCQENLMAEQPGRLQFVGLQELDMT